MRCLILRKRWMSKRTRDGMCLGDGVCGSFIGKEFYCGR